MAYARNRQDVSLHLMSNLVDSILLIEIGPVFGVFTQSVNLNGRST